MLQGGNIKSRFGLTARFLFWFLGITVVCVGVVAYMAYSASRKNLENAEINSLVTISKANESKIIAYFDSRKRVMMALANNKYFQDMKDLPVIQQEVNESYNSLKSGGVVTEIFLMDKDGKIIASSDSANVGADKKNDDYFAGVIKSNDFYIKDLNKSSNGQTEFVVSVPIYSQDSTTLVGVLAERLGTAGLYADLATNANLVGKTGDVYLVNDNDLAMAPTRYGGVGAVLNTKVDTQNVQDCLQGKEYAGLGKDYRGQDVFGSYSSQEVKKTLNKNWCVVTEKDLAEIDLPIMALRSSIFLVAGILFAAMLVLALYASRSIGEFVRRPIRNAVKQVTEAASVLAASTQQSSAAAQQNSSTAQQLAAGATEQSRQAEDVSKNVAQMAAAIQQMSASSQEAAQNSSKTAEMAQKAGQAGESSQKNLSQIKSLVNETAQMVKGIATSSEQIGEIVDTITSIAEQTNLLALNAAIEAARAGEAGRGFAVVADEVRKLAENSGKSAEEIKQRIKNVLGQVEQTVTAVETGVGSVDSSTKAISETLQSLQSISAAIQQVSAKIQEVSAGIQQQSASVQVVAKSMDNIASVSEQNASGAQQLSASTQQQSAANQQIAASTQQLMALGAELQKFVGGALDKAEQLVNLMPNKHKTAAFSNHLATSGQNMSARFETVKKEENETLEEKKEVVEMPVAPARIKRAYRRPTVNGVGNNENKEV